MRGRRRGEGVGESGEDHLVVEMHYTAPSVVIRANGLTLLLLLCNNAPCCVTLLLVTLLPALLLL